MGEMIDGVWHTGGAGVRTADGGFVRPATVFRDHIAQGGRFPPERGRYHLYVSLACPWAHRTLIFRHLKRLEPFVGLSVTHWLMGADGWTFADGEGVIPDPLGARVLHEVYTRADPRYTGRVTVPVLWDRREGTIVNNESADIIRMFNSAFDALGAAEGDFYPQALRSAVDAVNARIYAEVNNGVYRAGFATTQAAYESAVTTLFAALDWLEETLSAQPYLCGAVPTEADWRLFTTLIRFDAVYHGHFKCNLRRLADYPALSEYLGLLLAMPGIAGTVSLAHIKQHYYRSHPWINPTGIVPLGPLLGFAPDSQTT
jgi:putative glutathione S-transferase